MPFILPVSSIDTEDEILVGKKAVALAQLAHNQLPIPDFFVITTQGYEEFLAHNQLRETIAHQLILLDRSSPVSFQTVASQIRQTIINAHVPKALSIEFFDQFETLNSTYVAIRSSQITKPHGYGTNPLYLHVYGEASALELTKEVWASLFSAQKLNENLDPLSQKIAIIIQRMVNSDVAGLLHTSDPEGKKKQSYFIEAIYGYGEYLINQTIKPDVYEIDKTNGTLINQHITNQTIYLTKNGKDTLEKKVAKDKQDKAKISKEQIKILFDLGKSIQQEYYYPQTIEWVFDGNLPFILDTQDLLAPRIQDKTSKQKPATAPIVNLPLVCNGIGLHTGLTSGKLTKVYDKTLDSHEIALVSDYSPQLFEHLRHAKGLVIHNKYLDQELKLLSFDLGMPAVYTDKPLATEINHFITIDGSSGNIYKGELKLNGKTEFFSRPLSTTIPSFSKSNVTSATKVFSFVPAGHKLIKTNDDGVMGIMGEMIISELGVHPKKLLADKKESQITMAITKRVGQLCQVLHPKPVFYHLSDWHSQLQRRLDFGKHYQPKEANPILGLRGGLYQLLHPTLLKTELTAVKQLQQLFSNINLVLPLLRSTVEFEQLLKHLENAQIAINTHNQLWLNLETPANLIDIPQFLNHHISGCIVDLELLTAHTLGIDPTNADTMPYCNQLDPAVIWLVQHASQYCHKHEIPLVVLGQACSKYQILLEKLIEAGVWGLAVPSVEVSNTKKMVSKIEQKSII